MKNKTLIISGLLVWWAVFATPFGAVAASTGVPNVKGAVIRDYARITFEWPQTVFFRASASGKELTIRFDRKANPNMATLLSQLSPYVTHAERKADGKTIVLSLNKPYRIRTFVSDRINGVDLLGVDPKASRLLAKIKPKAPQEARIAPSVPAKTVAPQVAYGASEEQASALAQLSPAAGEPDQAPPPAPVELTKPEAGAALVGDSDPKPASEIKLTAPQADMVKVNVSAAIDSAVIRLPFAERVALAAFIRNRHLWIVFNKAMPVDLTDFDQLPRTVVGKAQLIKSNRASIVRMPIDDGTYMQVNKEEADSLDWAILLTSKKHELAKEVSVVVNTEPPAPAHVFIPLLDAADPVTVVDPQIGDRMIVVPFYGVDHGLAIKRDFVQFSLLPTVQGLAVVKKADDVSIVPLRNGLRISMPGGAVLTPGLPAVEAQKVASASLATATLFPNSLWKIDEGTNPRLYTNALFHRIALAQTPQEANEVRLRLAQYYLSIGMAPEALAHLQGINRVNPSFFRSSKLSALRGATNFLMGRFVEASRDFNASELNNNKEIDFWRSVLSDLLGNSDQSYDYLALNPDYFSKYPPILRQRLAIVAADRAIAAKEYNTALKIFDSLQQEIQIEAVSNYINFLMAKISLETGQEKDALETFDRLAEDFNRPFIRANAEFARIIWGVNNTKLTKLEAADRLERLRLGWHGDNLEMQVLKLLGDIYNERKDYLNAMRVWHGTIQSFPNTAIAITMNRQMQEAFIIMFNEGGFDALPPLEALAFYYEYRSYAPTGNTGDELVERLADRLVSVDLLTQATALLEHQMKFQVEKEKRSRVGARLASIHLLNRKPKNALEALEDSMYGENPLLLKLYRNRLTAEALSAMGEPDRAMQALGQDNSVDAEKIRQMIFWQQRDWKSLITSVESLLKQRADATAPITLDESEMLVKLSLAYVFTNDVPQLNYLRDYFSPLMKDNPNNPIFEFVTSPDMALTTRNFEEVISKLTSTRNFIENYQARIQTAGLATPAKPATNPTP
ncbi:MAG: hypothetical protein LW823_07725 [Rickettsiales bacterium]|jgi:tetratricopeptide (TPR) repeat protein|nr:hypothetical protein [Rickettsiales bacterium]